jgi:predicted DNA-binding mobile mystery protein A
MRRHFDQRLAGLDDLVALRPADGWVRAVREALGMSTYELAARMGVGHSRVIAIERAEVTGSVSLSTLSRAAEALNCRVCWVLVPSEPLEQMVRRQALYKAARAIIAATPDRDPCPEDLDHAQLMELEELADELVDRRGLWRADRREPA